MTTDIIYRYKNQVYFNITNKCPCRCTFCIRNTEDAIGEASNLWFEHEPALEEIYKAIDEFDFSDCNEVVFCGYGEPTMALENLIAVSKYIRDRYPFRIRLNTNGLSDLQTFYCKRNLSGCRQYIHQPEYAGCSFLQ